MGKLSVYLTSLVLAVILAVLTLYLSPRDPAHPAAAKGGGPRVDAGTSQTGWKKLETVGGRVLEGASYQYAREAAWSVFLRNLLRTAAVNVPGILLGWGAGFLLGSWMGPRLGRVSGRWLMAVTVAALIVPHPVWVALARILFLDTGLFRTADLLPPVCTLAFLTAPALAVNQAVLVAEAYRQRDVLFARSLGLPRGLTWGGLILPRSRSYWRFQAGLLLVSLCEGVVLIESAFDRPGLGRVAFHAVTASDPALLVLLVGVTTSLVNLGVLATVRLRADPPAPAMKEACS